MRGKLVLTTLIFATSALCFLYWTGSRQVRPPPLTQDADRLPLPQDDADVSRMLAQLPEATPEPAQQDEAVGGGGNITEDVILPSSGVQGKYNNPRSMVGFPGKEVFVKDVVDDHIYKELPDATATRDVLLDDYGDWSRLYKGTIATTLDGHPQPGDDIRRSDSQKPFRTFVQRSFRRSILSVNRLTKLLRLLNEGKDDDSLGLTDKKDANATIVRFAWCVRVAASLWRSKNDDGNERTRVSLSYFLKPGDGHTCDRLRAHDVQLCGKMFTPALVEGLLVTFFDSTTESVPRTHSPTDPAVLSVLRVLQRVCTPVDKRIELSELANKSLRFTPRKIPFGRVNVSNLPAGSQRRWPMILQGARAGLLSGSIRQVQMPRIAKKQEYVGEGTCDNSVREGGNGWTTEAFRLSILMDAEDVLELYAKDSHFFKAIVSSDSEQAKFLRGLLSSSHQSVACMVSVQNPALTFMRRSRWLLDAYRPFASELDLVGPNHEPKSFKRRPAMYRDDKPPTSDEFDLVVNRFVAGKKGFYTIKQLCGAIFYELRNVCLSPDGHGMSGFDAQGKPPASPDELRDERRQKIRGIRVMPRLTRPKFFLDKPLILHLVQFQSNNVGHVMYRINMLTNLIRNFFSENRTFDSISNVEEALIGMYVVPSALDTFGSSNSYKLYHQALDMSWFSVAALNVTRRRADEEEHDVCFRRAYLGMETAYMYHSKGGSGMAQKKMREAAAISQSLVARGLENLRNRLLRCYGMKFDINSGPQNPFVWHVASPSPAAPPPPWHVVVIVRTQRRIANQDILLAVLAAYMGVKHEALADGSSFRLIDPASRREVRVTIADYEFLLPQQQLELTSTAHVLFGVHGTAFQWMIAMQPGGVLVEFQFGGLGCIDGGINQDGIRMLCEFGKTSLAAGLSHIAVRYARPESIFLGPANTNWDVVVDTKHFLDIIASTMCLLEKGPRGARFCHGVLNATA